MSAQPAPLPAVHDRLVRRVSVTGVLETEGALHVGTGSGGGGIEASDMPVARDGHGRPYVPGSSLRGSLRAGLESLLRGLDRRVCDPFLREGHGDAVSCGERVARRRKALQNQQAPIDENTAFTLAWEESCEICRLFGHTFLASRLRIADLPLLDSAPTHVRDGVGIDRDLRSAATGILYQFEAVPSGARFGLRMEIENPEDHELGLLLVGLELFTTGARGLGGKSARGLGSVRVVEATWTVRVAEDYFTGASGTELAAGVLAAYQQRARDVYVGGA
jgi:CRISPR-associated protein Csm3